MSEIEQDIAAIREFVNHFTPLKEGHFTVDIYKLVAPCTRILDRLADEIEKRNELMLGYAQLIEREQKLLATQKILEEALENYQARLGVLKRYYPCIGVTLCHVDANCVGCWAAHCLQLTRTALSKIRGEDG